MKAKDWLIQWSIGFVSNSLVYLLIASVIAFWKPFLSIPIAFGFLTAWAMGATIGLAIGWCRIRLEYGMLLFFPTQVIPCLQMATLYLGSRCEQFIPDLFTTREWQLGFQTYVTTLVTLQLTIGWCLVFGMIGYQKLQHDREAWLKRRASQERERPERLLDEPET